MSSLTIFVNAWVQVSRVACRRPQFAANDRSAAGASAQIKHSATKHIAKHKPVKNW
jgi:hypothetical protein